MQRTLRPLLLISVVALITLATISWSAPASDETLSPARNFVFTSITHVPGIPAGYHQLKIWIPLPFEDRSQGISHLKIETPVRYRIQREKEYGNRYAYILVEAADTSAKPFDVRISFHAERFEDRVSLTPSIEPLGQPLVSPDR